MAWYLRLSPSDTDGPAADAACNKSDWLICIPNVASFSAELDCNAWKHKKPCWNLYQRKFNFFFIGALKAIKPNPDYA